jgi:hypothetical protein
MAGTIAKGRDPVNANPDYACCAGAGNRNVSTPASCNIDTAGHVRAKRNSAHAIESRLMQVDEFHPCWRAGDLAAGACLDQ